MSQLNTPHKYLTWGMKFSVQFVILHQTDEAVKMMGMDQWDEIGQPRRYQIKVKGYLDEKWSSWLEAFSIAYEGDATVLEGILPDQTALYGLLNKIRDLNLHLLAVSQIETDC